MRTPTVDLNGKRYDSITGALLGNSGHRQPTKPTGSPRSHQGRSLDGFASKSSINTALTPRPTAPSTMLGNRGITPNGTSRVVQKSRNNLAPHQPTHSLTLKRTAVRAPEFTMKPAIKRQAPVETSVPVANPIMQKPSVNKVNPDRLARAKQVPHSQHVQHFTPHRAQAIPQPRPVAAPPTAPPLDHRRSVTRRPVEQSEEDMFEQAIAHATSHQQKAPKRRHSWKRKLANTGGVILGLAAIAVFVVYLNLPTIELNIASNRAGFHVTMPNYKALGFTFQGPIKTSAGTVSMSFASGDSQFTLTQQASNWDNQTLMNSLATQSDTIPKAIQSNGHTIYMTHTNQATWVNGGVRYDLTGNANLNTQEIAAVANSL